MDVTERLIRRNVMTCSLHMLSLLWIVAAVLGALSRDSFVSSKIRDMKWIPFVFVGITITWVVISRVISPRTRSLLFLIWCVGLVSTVIWGANIPVFGQLIVYAAISLAATYLSLSVITMNIHSFTRFFENRFFYSFISVLMTITVFGMSFLIPGYPIIDHFPTFVVGTTTLVLSITQIWNTWTYLKRNPHLRNINNNCMFAVMSPWTETVDTFSVLSKHRE